MTVKELLNIEKDYKDKHKNVPFKYNELIGELMPENINDEISFLEKGHIAEHNSIEPNLKKNFLIKD
ncbi:MAG: hypothetical protein J1E57_03230 [Prevotella sp.]|nr:hypothetical protein [Prevotella sp.]